MTLTEQFSNDTKIRNYTRIYDPGHSWLEVPIKDVRDAAGVWDKITAYSPLKRHKFYLEEDCDTGKLINAIKAANIKFEDVLQELENRKNQSGIEEKNNRK